MTLLFIGHVFAEMCKRTRQLSQFPPAPITLVRGTCGKSKCLNSEQGFSRRERLEQESILAEQILSVHVQMTTTTTTTTTRTTRLEVLNV